MTRITRLVGGLAVAFGAIFFALGVASGTVSVADGLLFALGVIVANVPEGLLPTLTLALALGVQRLARGWRTRQTSVGRGVARRHDGDLQRQDGDIDAGSR